MEEEYPVSDKVRKLWAKEIELYLHFKEFCRKHGLRYYAVGGTALGAARHKGFSPGTTTWISACPTRITSVF